MAGVFVTYRPFGNPVLNTMHVGREVLVLAGAAIFMGCYVVNVQLFSNALTFGQGIAVLGGVVSPMPPTP